MPFQRMPKLWDPITNNCAIIIGVRYTQLLSPRESVLLLLLLLLLLSFFSFFFLFFFFLDHHCGKHRKNNAACRADLRAQELCEVGVAVLGSPSLISLMVSVDAKQH